MTAGEAPFSKENPVTIKVGASPVPHAAMLEAIKDDLAEMGVVVEIVEFTDYVLPNMSLEDGSIDANFFQHQPYLDDFNGRKAKRIRAGRRSFRSSRYISSRWACIKERRRRSTI